MLIQPPGPVSGQNLGGMPGMPPVHGGMSLGQGAQGQMGVAPGQMSVAPPPGQIGMASDQMGMTPMQMGGMTAQMGGMSLNQSVSSNGVVAICAYINHKYHIR